MRRVILESPYGSEDSAVITANIEYARACVRDCLMRGESPLASHLLYTQPGILRDSDPEERSLGILAGLAWAGFATASVVYTDRGISRGMKQGIEEAKRIGLSIEYRSLKQAS